jgi:two-component system, sensor histidine kinase and response regulator
MHPIIIVDDEKDNLQALQRLLRNQYDLTTTTSPFEAFKLLQKTEFHVIISDQRMPEMSGVELLEKVKHVSPITTRILLTGYTDIESVIGAINRGNIYRYIAKPWDPEELKLTLRQADEAYCLRKEIEVKNLALSTSNQELQKALESLRQLDRAKARFLSLISHELNTPLTVLQSFTGLLSDAKSKFTDDLKKAVTALEGASSRFGEIISEVLTYVKLEAEIELHRKPFDLRSVTKKVIDPWKKSLATQGIKVTLEPEGEWEVNADPSLIKIAVERLLKDLISQSPKEETIRIEFGHEPNSVRYSVWRAGAPLAKEAFSPLVASGAEMNHHKNLGLGLAICKLAVEAHGGEVVWESSEKKGTQISLSFPVD